MVCTGTVISTYLSVLIMASRRALLANSFWKFSRPIHVGVPTMLYLQKARNSDTKIGITLKIIIRMKLGAMYAIPISTCLRSLLPARVLRLFIA